MSKEKISSIFHELEQICSQYEEQVPGRRRAWPNAIKERIYELKSLGLSSRQIAKRVPVPYMTIISWAKRSPKFLAVKVKASCDSPAATSALKAPRATPSAPRSYDACNVTTVTVVTPAGLRVEGLPLEIAMNLLGLPTQSGGGGI